MFGLRKKWQAALCTTLVLTLSLEGIPADAKQEGERRGNIQIEADKGLALDKLSSKKRESELVVIQLSGPVREEWKEELEDIGVTLGDYIPDYAFIAKIEDEQVRREVEELTFVEDVMAFTPKSKVSSELRFEGGNRERVDVAVIGFNQRVDMYRTMTKMTEDQDIRDIQSPEDAPHISIAKMDQETIEQVIESDDVIAVVPVPENKLHNDVAATIIHSDKLASTGYTGKGQIVGVADTGLDTGKLQTMHPDFKGQIEKLISLGRPNDASDVHGHGTHVAGSLVGTGEASDGQYKGTAPGAKLIFHSIENAKGKLVTDVETILQEAYEEGARIHSNSWGADDKGEYSLSSLLFDRFLWEHPDMTVLVAAGNDGEKGYKTIGSPATAKNVIAVGATENVRPNLGKNSDKADDVWVSSSRGLTGDGRLKPDIVAPGTAILSTRSSLAPSKNFYKRFNEHYAYMSGTSMATPILAGGVAQIREFLQEEGEKNPSGALVKAMLLTSADNLDEDIREQGFGRANLANAIETSYKDEKDGIRTREKVTYKVKVSDDSKPLAITLAWTDYPAAIVAKRALVNDLNLKVTTPSGEKLNGNDFFEAPYNDEVDNLNNVEQVWITEPEEGTYTVMVEGYNIPKGPQPYALATTGKWQKTDDEEEEEPPVEEEPFRTGKLTKKKKYMDYSIRVNEPGDLELSVDWKEDADVDLYVYNSRSKELASATTSDNPEQLTVNIEQTGLYKIRVMLKEGKEAKYRLYMNKPQK
ncbi:MULTISPECIES: S8 family serine peptidase [Brevibacillus]|uniref:S8 family serine peptidase n=1 Tax=Brevibacillus TaxID=55080 RepID=UPI000D11353F|nr:MULTISPECIES: S8 family serine peptidase [Brevibacillus]MED1943689.1 S8 family serine peptidase [Brevibacillus formosus]MED1999939.1 S8 family serine peptidase [Brevibacillus formosus]MED2081924.1 S8 family serine peptidase [Brevibacillus formosus]PSK19137.1 peptidase S8 [Brevibacillus sp. NRRL NRS-603]